MVARGVVITIVLGWLLCTPLAAQWAVAPASSNSGFVGMFGLPSGDVDVSVSSNAYDAYGYASILVTLTAKKASTADRTYTVDLGFHSYGDRSGLKTSCDLDLPAGQTTVSKSLTVLRLGQWYRARVSLWGDGRPSPDNPKFTPAGLSSQPVYMRSGNRNPYSYAQYSQWPHEEVPHMLIISKGSVDQTFLTGKLDAQGNRELISLFEIGPLFQAPGTQINPGSQQLEGLAISTPEDFSEGWINHSSLDVIGISLADLAGLAESRPAAVQAIRDWTFAGGNLWVWGVGEQWAKVAELEKLLGMSPQPLSAEIPPISTSWDDLWRKPRDEDYYQVSEIPDPNNSNQRLRSIVAGKPDLAPEFIVREFGLGCVAAIARDDALHAWSVNDWTWLCNTLTADRLLGWHRYGFSAVSENSDFWNFLISGVGMPPIETYRVLITVFVVFIGPINYWVLRRSKRLHLLLFSVPACAGVVTLALLGYALISDGLDTQVRVRSFTQIDQRVGEMASWSRLSYYAGLKPSEGLTFPTDTAVFPVEAQPDHGYRYDTSPARTMFWGDQQRLTAGWLDAREPTQFMTVRSGPTKRQLEFEPGDPPQVRNELGGQILSLLLVSHDGRMYRGSDIAAGAKEKLTLLAEGGVSQGTMPIRDAVLQHRPTFPPDWQSYSTGPFGFRRHHYYGASNNTSSLSRLEKSIERVNDIYFPDALAPGSYVAIVDRMPDVSVGLESVTEVESFYVVVGRW